MQYTSTMLESAFQRFGNFKTLGQGGEGAVFAVWDRIRKSDLALKLMRDTGYEDVGERFEYEYETLASLRSDRLVRVFDHGVVDLWSPDGTSARHYWYTMERCESSVQVGLPADDARAARGHRHADAGRARVPAREGHRPPGHQAGQPLPGERVADQDRRFRPGEGQYAAVGDGESVVRLGDIIGSPPYLAPERWVGVQDADWRPSDQYAAGVTMFELLSAGRMPLDFGETQESYFPGAPPSGKRARAAGPGARGARELPVGRLGAREDDARRGREMRYADVAECKRELAGALALDGV